MREPCEQRTLLDLPVHDPEEPCEEEVVQELEGEVLGLTHTPVDAGLPREYMVASWSLAVVLFILGVYFLKKGLK